MEIKQQLKMSQQLVMTPQLQQAIKLLQMSRMELVETVREELLENPLLDEQLDGEVKTDAERAAETTEGTSATQGEGGEEGKSIEAQASTDTASAQETSENADPAENADKKDEVDWEQYLENHAMQAPMPSYGARADGDDTPGFEATLTRSGDLVDHLAWQLRMGDFVEDEQKFGALVIGNLDENGCLEIEGVDESEVVPRLAEEAGLHPEDAEEVLLMMQKFDPIGVATRSLKECLLVQARHFGMDDLVIQTLDRHLQNLERRNYGAIAKDLAVDVEEIYDVAQVIAELDPRPGRNFTDQEPQYITPDVYVHRVGDEYFVVANDDGMPKLKISGFYRSALKGNAEAREYVQNKLRSAQWLIRSIDQRRKTIVKVTECIVEKQRAFFDLGIEHLRPMILRDVAETVGMHESTISRVTSNKYVHTPRGLFELKYFFNSAIRRANQDDIASESVKQAIKKLIGAEDPKKPYSDQKLVELLGQDGIKIARRTVAKYREMLGILSSSKRKKYF